MEKFIISVEEAISLMGSFGSSGISPEALRAMLRADVCSFGKAYKRYEEYEKYSYMIDRQALVRCMEGKQNFFK